MNFNITGLTVVYETTNLIHQAVDSIRKFYPTLDILIIDGSKYNSECYKYLDSIEDEYTKIIHAGYNINHGNGMNLGINQIRTDYILLFDSDIIMNKPPLEDMMKCFEDKDLYGVGGITSYRGARYLHPAFAIINRIKYHQYAPYKNDGAPAVDTMCDIKKRGHSGTLLKFPTRDYITHLDRGTLDYIQDGNTIAPRPGAIDVLSKIISKINNNKLSLKASNAIFGDPLPGICKILYVDYILDGVSHTEIIKENHEITIEAINELKIIKAMYGHPKYVKD